MIIEMRNLKVVVSGHLYITYNMEIDNGIKYIEDIVSGHVLKDTVQNYWTINR